MTRNAHDRGVLATADQVIRQVFADVHTRLRRDDAVIVAAPAGAGKSYLVESVVDDVLPNHRVAVAAPTNEQVFDITRRIADRLSRSQTGEEVMLLHARQVTPPDDLRARRNVLLPADAEPNDVDVLVGTVDKLGDAFIRGDLRRRELLVIDECYQASSSQYLKAGGLAPTHLLVGDPGQIDPFSTLPDGDYWRGLPEDPIQTAVGVLLRNHSIKAQHFLPITRRLAPAAAVTAAAFYPGRSFASAVRSGVRRLAMGPAVCKSTDRVINAALDEAAATGWGYLQLPAGIALPTDPDTLELAVTTVDWLFRRTPQVSCENHRAPHDLTPPRVGVAVSHRDQVSHLRARLDSRGHSAVKVETANRLQGLEFDVVVAVHPLTGLAEPDAFHLDPGRMCVMLTRHRHACVVIGREGDPDLLNGIPPSTPAYLGWDPDPTLDGWSAQRLVYDTLLRHCKRVA